MHIFRTNRLLRSYLDRHRREQKSIGYVPTLGALHPGHMSLIKSARAQNDIVVCSIFVNPTQFNDKSDLAKYPRTIEADIELLLQNETHILYYPRYEEVYPPDLDTGIDIDLGYMGEVLEAAKRPGHFEGVMQVVKRLLDIVEPDRLYMGQKDFQQYTIIGYMLEQLKMPTELIVCPIVREANGLAMSSRNERLSPEARQRAGVLYATLCASKSGYDLAKISEIEATAMRSIKEAGLEPEYFTIVDGLNLSRPDSHSSSIVASTAAWIEGVRLIDNIRIQ